MPLERLLQRTCDHVGIAPASLRGGGRRPAVVHAREGIAFPWVDLWGRSGRALAPVLGVRPQAVYQAAARGRTVHLEWERLIKGGT